jgi:uncharacterized protein (TIGR01777 family)
MAGILISGGTGLIGQELTAYLSKNGNHVKILSRKPTNPNLNRYHYNVKSNYIDPEAFKDVQVVINLSGSKVIGNRWTKSNKERHRSSRVDTTKLLVQKINANNTPIEHFIQASAMGYYGDHADTLITEDSTIGNDFLAQLCGDWESESLALNDTIKRSILRIGLYLSTKGGVYKSLKTLSRFYLASSFGNGRQFTNYTHRDEFNNMVHLIIQNKVSSGIYNVVGPEPFTLNQLVRSIARANNSKVLLPNIPSFVLKAVLGEASSTLLHSYRIKSTRLPDQYYLYKNLDEALDAL